MRISDWSSDVCSSDLATSSFSFSFFDSSDLGMPEESPHPLEVWPIQEVLARMTLGVSFTFFAVRINATTEVTEDSIPCTTPPNLRCQSQLGGGLINAEGNRIDSIPLPERSEEHTSELQSLMRISYAVFLLNKKNTK